MTDKKAEVTLHESTASEQFNESQATAAAQATGEAEKRKDETIPGGRYLAADGKTLTNCWGQKIDENGKVLDQTMRPER